MFALTIISFKRLRSRLLTVLATVGALLLDNTSARGVGTVKAHSAELPFFK